MQSHSSLESMLSERKIHVTIITIRISRMHEIQNIKNVNIGENSTENDNKVD